MKPDKLRQKLLKSLRNTVERTLCHGDEDWEIETDERSYDVDVEKGGDGRLVLSVVDEDDAVVKRFAVKIGIEEVSVG